MRSKNEKVEKETDFPIQMLVVRSFSTHKLSAYPKMTACHTMTLLSRRRGACIVDEAGTTRMLG